MSLVILKALVIIILATLAGTALLRAAIVARYRTIITLAFVFHTLVFVALCLPDFLLSSFLVMIVAIAVPKARSDIPGLAVFVIVAVPALALPIAVGGVPLIPVSTTHAAMVGLALAQFRFPNKATSRVTISDISIITLVLLFVFMQARSTSLTNFARVTLDLGLTYILPCVLVSRNLRAEGTRAFLVYLTCASVFVAAIAVYESYSGWPIYQTIREHFNISGLSNAKMRAGFLRAGGPMMNPPASSAILALCAVALAGSRTVFRNIRANQIVFVFVFIGLFAMQSRTGWIGLIVGIAFLVFIRGNTKAVATFLVAGAVAAAAAVMLSTVSPEIATWLGLTGDAAGSNDYRRILLTRGIETVQQNPVIGLPMDEVAARMADLRQGEGMVDFVNAYLAVALNAGLIGLAIFVASLCAIFYATYSYAAKEKRIGGVELTALGPSVMFALLVMLPFHNLGERLFVVAIMISIFGGVAGKRRPVRGNADVAPDTPTPPLGHLRPSPR